MLTISKPTLFTPDGLAARGQCNHDSPGWQLRWFDRRTAPVVMWQGAFKTCRHLQSSCAAAETLDEVRRMVDELLNATSFTQFANQPTDSYPSQRFDREAEGGGSASSGQSKKKKKRRRH